MAEREDTSNDMRNEIVAINVKKAIRLSKNDCLMHRAVHTHQNALEANQYQVFMKSVYLIFIFTKQDLFCLVADLIWVSNFFNKKLKKSGNL